MRRFNTEGPIRLEERCAIPLCMANSIYAGLVPRELGYTLQSSLERNPPWCMNGADCLDMRKLPTAFRTFYGEYAEHGLGRSLSTGLGA